MSDMSFSKESWRDTNLAFLRDQKFLWKKNARGKDEFGYVYVELLGDTGDAMYTKMQEYLPHDAKGRAANFIGIDKDVEILMRHTLKETKPRFRFVFGDAYVCIPHLFSRRELEGGAAIGAVNLDTTSGIRAAWWQERETFLKGTVDRALNAKGAPPGFALILNHTLDRGGEKGVSIMDRIATEAEGLARVFGSWELRKEALLQGTEKAAQPGFVDDWAGGFEIYRSKNDLGGGHRVRMITTRLVFNKQTKQATVYQKQVASGPVV